MKANNMNAQNAFYEMTNYDIFMMNKNKKKASTKLFDKRPAEENISYENYRKKIGNKDYQERLSYNSKENAMDYETYLLNELSRKSPGKILNENEFYGEDISINKTKNKNIKSNINGNREKNKISEKRAGFFYKLTKKLFGDIEFKKGSKIFVIFYVLLVVAVASTLIVMNSSSSSNMLRTSNAETVEEYVESENLQSMVIENNEDSEKDWFDKFCDSLNK